MAVEKFKLQPGERTLMKGDLQLSEGEAGVANFFKGKYRIIQCTAFLTNQRFVACKKRQFFPWGLLIWLIMAMTKRKIVFAIPLGNLASVKSEPGKSTAFILQTSAGQEYKLNPVSIFNKRKQWIDAIGAAVSQNCPGVKVLEGEGLVSFSRG
jgi:hypothetical protein